MADGEIAGLRAAARVRGTRSRASSASATRPRTRRSSRQRLIDAYARLPKLAGHVHLPVQSGSDRILAAMKRGYTTLEYKSIVRRLRAARPGISISSDFIVGFPGETEDGLRATMRLVRGRLRRLLLVRLQPAPRHARRRSADDTPQRGEARAPAAAAGGDRRPARADQRARWWARCSASWSRGRRRRTPAELAGRTGQQPRREFRRTAARPRSGRFVDVTHHRRRCRIRCAANSLASEAPRLSASPVRVARQILVPPGAGLLADVGQQRLANCAARSTRTCGRSRPRSTWPSAGAASNS